MTATLPPFPVDDATLEVLRDALTFGYSGNSEDGPVPDPRSAFRLAAVLELFAGYHGEGDCLYSTDDVIHALIDEIQRLRNEANP